VRILAEAGFFAAGPSRGVRDRPILEHRPAGRNGNLDAPKDQFRKV
jgi:hypothetical protein